MRCKFEAGEHKILAKVADGFAESSPLEIVVHVGEFTALAQLEVPLNLRATREDEGLKLEWRDAPKEAKYAFVKVNGLGLVYADTSDGEIWLSDVEYENLRDIEVAWMDAEYNVGEFATLDMSGFENVRVLGGWDDSGLPDDTPNETLGMTNESSPTDTDVPVKTGVAFGAIGLFVLVIIILVAIKILASSHKNHPSLH